MSVGFSRNHTSGSPDSLIGVWAFFQIFIALFLMSMLLILDSISLFIFFSSLRISGSTTPSIGIVKRYNNLIVGLLFYLILFVSRSRVKDQSELSFGEELAVTVKSAFLFFACAIKPK